MIALQKTLAAITGRLSCVHAGIRLSQRSHPWAEEAAGVISAAPAEVTEWLKLADRLDEEGNPAAHMIRAVFTDGFVPPAGFNGHINRGGRYMENGQHYDEGVTIRFLTAYGDDGPSLNVSYWSNGGWAYRPVTTAVARSLLAARGGRHVSNWYNLTVEGSVPPTGAVVPAGTPVRVWKGDSRGNTRIHTTTETVPVANHDQNVYGTTVVFSYRGWTIEVDRKHIDVF